MLTVSLFTVCGRLRESFVCFDQSSLSPSLCILVSIPALCLNIVGRLIKSYGSDWQDEVCLMGSEFQVLALIGHLIQGSSSNQEGYAKLDRS